ncbi:pyridoxal phosphate homeostasis protein [Trichomonascus vanleenenianus]|uniref:pyridoxal phosphate homeostasis protein n=1 Tax=Trichomonascus vanleenenianus TaxID=2268995 RepID=UPI003ECA05FD
MIRILRRAMSERAAELKQNYHAIKQQVEGAAGQGVRLVVVSKYKPIEDIKVLYDEGHRHFGENYVQELLGKIEQLPKDIKWHFIGSLQSNKAKQLAQQNSLYAVETLDSESKANKLNNARAAEADKLNVFLQINTSGEDQKSGLREVDEIVKVARHVVDKCDKLNLQGLMTIGSVKSSLHSEGENKDFARLIEIKTAVEKEIGRTLEASMGMSNDFAQAIKQGSTNVRVGSSIFGARKTKEEMKT